MGIYVGDTAPSKIFVGGSEVASVRAGDTKVRPTTPPYRTFTVSWVELSSPSSWVNTYSDDATGMTQSSGDFDDFFGYDAVLLGDDGSVIDSMTQTGGVFEKTMTNFINSRSGNVMIRFPKRGIKMTKSGTTVTLSITEDPNKDGYQYYAFNDHGIAQDYLYLGAFKGSISNTKLVSVSGTSSVKSIALLSAAQAANKYGNNRYHEITWFARQYINALYKMKRANPDSQSVIGVGWGGYSPGVSTGGTNSIIDATGTTNKTSSSGRIKLFGLEDRWGNVLEGLDGCQFNSGNKLKVSTTQDFNTTSSGNIITSFDITGIQRSGDDGFISGIVGDNYGMFAGSNGDGGASTYYCDYFGGDTSAGALYAGGCWYPATYGGAFTIEYGNQQYSSNSMGCRLMYL